MTQQNFSLGMCWKLFRATLIEQMITSWDRGVVCQLCFKIDGIDHNNIMLKED